MHSMTGAVTGMRFEAIYPLIDRMAADKDEWDALLYDLEVMERAALKVINDKD